MLKIRLRRMGSTHRPYYRVVVGDSRKVPTGAALEELGHYDPRPTPPKVTLDRERIAEWVGKGAQLSPTVKRLLALPVPVDSADAASDAGSADA